MRFSPFPSAEERFTREVCRLLIDHHDEWKWEWGKERRWLIHKSGVEVKTYDYLTISGYAFWTVPSTELSRWQEARIRRAYRRWIEEDERPQVEKNERQYREKLDAALKKLTLPPA